VLICCWSSKGGTGTTVVAVALALTLARRDGPAALLADLAGDAPTVLGLSADPTRHGITDWLRDGVAPQELPVREGLALLPRGTGPLPAGQADVLVDTLGADARNVVIDAGVIDGTRDLGCGVALAAAAAATHSLIVLRPCFVALRRALLAPLRPSAVVLVEEDGRALTASDVEDALGVPVRARVRVTPQIARAVDAGLLVSHLPRTLERDLHDAA
jgi:cellulose biosynthesis protein BcsQ